MKRITPQVLLDESEDDGVFLTKLIRGIDQHAEMFQPAPAWRPIMPKIDFCFSGWVRGAAVTKITTAAGNEQDVTGEDAESVAKNLEAGEYFISLGDYLYDNSHKCEIELFDFDESSD